MKTTKTKRNSTAFVNIGSFLNIEAYLCLFAKHIFHISCKILKRVMFEFY